MIIPQVKKGIQYRVMTCTEQSPRLRKKRRRDSPEYPKSTDQTDFFRQSMSESHKNTQKHTQKPATRKYVKCSLGCKQCVHKIRTSSKFCTRQEATLTTTQTIGRYANSDNRGSQNGGSTVFSNSVCSGKLHFRILLKPTSRKRIEGILCLWDRASSL